MNHFIYKRHVLTLWYQRFREELGRCPLWDAHVWQSVSGVPGLVYVKKGPYVAFAWSHAVYTLSPAEWHRLHEWCTQLTLDSCSDKGFTAPAMLEPGIFLENKIYVSSHVSTHVNLCSDSRKSALLWLYIVNVWGQYVLSDSSGTLVQLACNAGLHCAALATQCMLAEQVYHYILP